MKTKTIGYVAGILILGLAILAGSCGGKTAAPTEVPPTTEGLPPTPPAPTTPTAPVAPAPTAPATPAVSPPAIPHTLEGRSDCLVCHRTGAFKPFPADHAGRTSATCTACHQPAP